MPGAHAFHRPSRRPSTRPAVAAAHETSPGSRVRLAGHRALPGGQGFRRAITAGRTLIASPWATDFSWAHATDEKIHRPLVGRLIDLVEADPSPPSTRYQWNWGGAVTIVTKSGARYTSSVDAPRGSGPRGIEWSDVDAKFRALMPESGLSLGPRKLESAQARAGKKRSALTGRLACFIGGEIRQHRMTATPGASRCGKQIRAVHCRRSRRPPFP